MDELKKQVFTPEANSIVLVKRPSETNEEAFYGALLMMAEDMRQAGLKVMLIGVDDFADISLLSEDEMEERGWVRKERVLAYKSDEWPGFEERRQALLEEEE